MARPSTGLRERILDSALRRFVRHGFRGASLADIASDTGCSKASLLYHFSNKEAILAELLLPISREVTALDARLGGLEGREAAEAAVAGFVDLALRFRRELKLLFDNLGDLDSISELHDEFEDVDALKRRLVDAMAGRSEEPLDRVAATMTLGGMLLTGTADHLSFDDETLREALTTGALRALGRTRG